MAENNQQAPTPQQASSTTTATETAADAQAGNSLNVVTEHTGQFDVRFLLWREFCTETGVAVDAMPSELQGELKERWDKMKDSQLHKPAEETSTPPVTNS